MFIIWYVLGVASGLITAAIVSGLADTVRGKRKERRSYEKRIHDAGGGGGGTGHQPGDDHALRAERCAGSPVGELREDVPDSAGRVCGVDGGTGKRSAAGKAPDDERGAAAGGTAQGRGRMTKE